MDFELPEEMAALREVVRCSARDKTKPRAREVVESGAYPGDMFEVFAQADLLGPRINVEWDGSGPGVFGLTIAVEEVAKRSSACS